MRSIRRTLYTAAGAVVAAAVLGSAPVTAAPAVAPPVATAGREAVPHSVTVPTTPPPVAPRPPALTGEWSTGASGAAPAAPAADPVSPPLMPLQRPTVVLYGDSLAWEARGAFAMAFADRHDVHVHERTFGGTAICDWLATMADDVATLRPGAVVVEFSGNNFTPCMHDDAGLPLTGDALVERYAADAAAVAATFTTQGTLVIFAGAPVAADRDGDGSRSITSRLNERYAELGRTVDAVRYVDAGASVLDDGTWTATLPCLSWEPCGDTGVNKVRAPDGLHFCPASGEAVRGVTGECPVWSSGAVRFGAALAAPVIEHLAAG